MAGETLMIEREGNRNSTLVVAYRFLLLALLVATFALTVHFVLRETSTLPGIPKNGNNKQRIDCAVLIIGSGFAGSFAAYQLAPRYNSTLCLIEGLNRYGGRIYDVSEYPGGPVFGTGALRIAEVQTTMLSLATELNITLQIVEKEVGLMKVRGSYYYRGASLNDSAVAEKICRERFLTVNCTTDATKTTIGVMFETLAKLYEESPHLIDQSADFPSLLTSLFGDEGMAYFRENTFRSAFRSMSSRAVMEFLGKSRSGGRKIYPVGGMSEYIRRMIRSATDSGVRIYCGEPVLSIESRADWKFVVETPNFIVHSEKILCSITPTGFANVTGDVAEQVKSSEEFRGILPTPTVTLAGWWNERWWEKSSLHGERNLTRVTSNANCFNGMEIPTISYSRDQNVTRVVYDDGACIEMWRTLLEYGHDSEKLASEIVKSLKQVFYDVEIPRPRTLRGHIHVDARHYQKASSRKTNNDVFMWSLKPTQREGLMLIGEAYNLNYAGWADATLKSTMTVLTRFYNFTYPCNNDPGSPADCSLSRAKRTSKFVAEYLTLP